MQEYLHTIMLSLMLSKAKEYLLYLGIYSSIMLAINLLGINSTADKDL